MIARSLRPLRTRLLDAAGRPAGGLAACVFVVGVVGGVVGACYLAALRLLERVLWPTHWATGSHLVVLLAVGASVGIVTRVLGNPGDVELLVDNIHVTGGPEDIRNLRSLIPVSLLCIASGGAMGPEAPLVQTCGSLGAWLARRWRLGVPDTRTLTITGMAAAFTVLFGAPLGSAIFALEILHRRGLEYYEALLPAVIGALAGYAVYVLATGLGLQPVWHFPDVGILRAADVPWALGCGAVGAGIAWAFTYLSRGLRALFRPIGPTLRPVVGALVLGLLAFASPYALTFGEAQVGVVSIERGAALVFVLAAAAKLAGTSVTLSSGWRGGFIIPMFFIGAALGRFGHALFPGSNVAVLMTATMAAINVGVTKTTFGSTLVVSEMAGLRLLPTTIMAAVVALLLTSQVGLIETQRVREGAFGVGTPIAGERPDRRVDQHRERAVGDRSAPE